MILLREMFQYLFHGFFKGYWGWVATRNSSLPLLLRVPSLQFLPRIAPVILPPPFIPTPLPHLLPSSIRKGKQITRRRSTRGGGGGGGETFQVVLCWPTVISAAAAFCSTALPIRCDRLQNRFQSNKREKKKKRPFLAELTLRETQFVRLEQED